MSFCVWLTSLSIMLSRFIHVVTFVSNAFVFSLNYIALPVQTTFSLSMHPLMDRARRKIILPRDFYGLKGKSIPGNFWPPRYRWVSLEVNSCPGVD